MRRTDTRSQLRAATGRLPRFRGRLPAVRPARTIFIGFLAAGVIGTGLLMLPNARSGVGSASPLEALFTAVSALCVTGLITVDTPSHWTPFGHVVILALIQVGGFGVMTFASVIGIAVLRRMSYRSTLTTATEAKSLGLDEVRAVVFGVVKISVTIEAVVALILTVRFLIGYGRSPGEAVWLGVFHAVSAFNNAGFSLFSSNMIEYVTDPVNGLTMCGAIIIGGLGFPVIMQLRRHARTPRLWTMNTRLVIAGTVVLLVGGTVFITAMEWSNPRTLGGLEVPGKLLAGFFQAVQTRTAGFNSIDIGAMDSATWLGMDVLMFIGGGPAGTAGGIKITTFAVLLFIIVTEIRGEGAVNVFGKRLSRAVHRQAIAVALLAVALVVISTLVLLLITDYSLDQVLFEVTSAFASVGLSTGITAGLPAAGQLILVVLMFIGRVGPITFATALALRGRQRSYEYPKERPIIG
ncbi:TrkH family potassium uptake protein [Microlunatus parietis]|uniref:Potassium uptake TrkH family protein n=1 Tax=Microlunatus parietis TaxID=682979 RepID=A0A7Y9L9S7_9ACTN|nr:potassium transporter TrkG [Microlunatus parietis]NYE69902.1 potassium uptake TrkH family protein [Microlunatus parietis]